MPGTRSITHASPRSWFRYQFFEKKLNTGFGYTLLAVIGLAMVAGTVLQNYLVGPITIAGIAALAVAIAVLKYPYFGFYFMIGYSTLAMTLDRLVSIGVPSGTFVEFFSYLLLFRIMLSHELKKSIDDKFWTNGITVMFYVQFCYFAIELLNPAMFSQLGWFSFFRKQLSYLIFFYMAYSLLNTKERMLYFVRFIIMTSTLCALYACKQQWFGYAQFERNWIGTGNGFQLLFQGGVLRKFSVFSDPASSGILFASVTLLCIIMLLRSTKTINHKWLYFAIVVNLLGYTYSGTRTATLILVAGICLYVLATLNERRSMQFLLGAVGLLVFLMVIPYKTSVTDRILSTFEGTKDQSAALRDFDRRQVQPYIQGHPIGGGIFTCGAEGPKYNPGHPLELLQPDSGYMKVLAEEGPIGLAILLVYYFVILQFALQRFFHGRDPEIRNYYIALLIMMFCLMVAQYSQLAITQYPITLFFQGILVIFIRLADYDTPVEAKPETLT